MLGQICLSRQWDGIELVNLNMPIFLQWQLGARVPNLIPVPNYVSDYNISWQFMVSPLMMQLLSKFFVELLELIIARYNRDCTNYYITAILDGHLNGLNHIELLYVHNYVAVEYC